MSLSLELQRYLKVRRNLGYDLSTSERVLKQFVSFMESKKRDTHYVWSVFTMETGFWESVPKYMGKTFGNGPVVCILVTQHG